MLRTSFPVNVQTDSATCDIQYGHLKRLIHRNTTWDMARFEVAAQKYVDLSDQQRGVALLNDCKYGHKLHATSLTFISSVHQHNLILTQIWGHISFVMYSIHTTIHSKNLT